MKKAQSLVTMHFYYILVAGLLLTAIVVSPFLMQADVTNNDNDDSCSKPSDRDCDGAPRCTTSVCNVGDDEDDDDENVGGFVPPPRR